MTDGSTAKSQMILSSLPFITGIVGFVLGILLVFLVFVIPQQRLITRKDALVNQMVAFNIQEQERLADMRNISEAQLQKWVAINEEASREYQEIFNTLRKQERQFANPGVYWVTIMLVALFVLIAFYIWANRNENIKDIATLENFESFVEQRLMQSSTVGELSDSSRDILIGNSGKKDNDEDK